MRLRYTGLLNSFKTYWPLIAAVSGAFWALWQFYFKEIYVPANTPANLIVDLDLEAFHPKNDISARKPATFSPHKAVPITLMAKVVNSSDKSMQLLNPYWIAYGIDVKPGTTGRSEVFLLNIQNRMFGRRFLALEGVHTRRHFLGMGTLFDDEVVMPKEVLATRKVLPLYNREYEIVQVNVVVASARDVPKGKLVRPVIEFTNLDQPSPRMCWSMVDESDLRGNSVKAQSPRLGRPLADGSSADYAPCRGVPHMLSDKQLNRFNVQVTNAVSEIWME